MTSSVVAATPNGQIGLPPNPDPGPPPLRPDPPGSPPATCTSLAASACAPVSDSAETHRGNDAELAHAPAPAPAPLLPSPMALPQLPAPADASATPSAETASQDTPMADALAPPATPAAPAALESQGLKSPVVEPKNEPQEEEGNGALTMVDYGHAYAQAASVGLLSNAGISPEFIAMMQLARMAKEHNMPAMRTPMGPNTITPAEMSLSSPVHCTPAQLHSHSANGLQSGNGSYFPEPHDAAATRPELESFARIEFPDSVFQMTTYAVIIGRDQRALEQARIDERRKQEYDRRVEENAAKGLPPPSPPAQNPGKFSKSYVSEEGGMLGPESNGDEEDENPRPSKRRKTSGGGGSGSGSQLHQKKEKPREDASHEQQETSNRQNVGSNNRQYIQSHTPGASMVDLASLRPSPYYVPLIGIHSPGPDIASKTKSISREHMKIQYNHEKGVFEAIPLHRNGFFRGDVLYREGRVVLRSGDRLQIKDVDFVFIINGVKSGCTGAEDEVDKEDVASSTKRHSEGGKEMSFEFESSHAEEMLDSSDEGEGEEAEGGADEESANGSSPVGKAAEEEEDEEEGDEGEGEDGVMETVESDEQEAEPMPDAAMLALELGLPLPPKKRGPGRPPKNGIMSKREERLRRKMAAEAAKKAMPQPPPGEPVVKRKVGRPRKHPLPEEGGEKTEKRKYKPRKPKNAEDGAEEDPEKVVKEKRREKPKTPPLELRAEDFTPEQLEKPNKNYGVLIDEVLRDAPQGLSLKQIYKRIQQKYPYYYFSVETKGWESSVRHNLIGNDAFKKNDETHLWTRIPGIELDAGKKRKANSPDHPVTSLHHLGPPWNQPQMPPHHPHYQAEQAATPGAPPSYRPNNALPPHAYPPNSNQPYNGVQGQQHYPMQAAVPNTAASQQGVAKPPSYPLPPQAQTQVPAQVSAQATPQATPQTAAQSVAQTPAPAQVPGYGPATVNRPLQMGSQPGSYSSPYAAKPPPGAPTTAMTGGAAPPPPPSVPTSIANGGHPGAPVMQRPPQPSPATPIQRAPPPPNFAQPRSMPANGQAAVPSTTANMRPSAPAGVAAPPAVSNGARAPLKPVVDPGMLNFIKNFKAQVISQLERRFSGGEDIAMSVINRGIGLSTTNTVPDKEAVERLIFGVFEQAKGKLTASHILQPRLLELLTRVKQHWIEIIMPKLGRQKSEFLLLSAIDRVLGFTDKSLMHPAHDQERKEFEEAESLLMVQIRREVDAYQRSISGLR